MALIKCNECGKEISDKAKECIHCGCPIINEKIKCDECKSEFSIDLDRCPNCGNPNNKCMKLSYKELSLEEKRNITAYRKATKRYLDNGPHCMAWAYAISFLIVEIFTFFIPFYTTDELPIIGIVFVFIFLIPGVFVYNSCMKENNEWFINHIEELREKKIIK